MTTQKTILTIAIVLLLATALYMQTWISWDGADTIPVAGGLVTIDAYDGMVRIPMFGLSYCPQNANCGRY